ncbi:MAG: HAMP domain-containing sensor histidine kinase, partial [Nitrospirota bacterium]|nr:HAMP domain-containing sensor histidine kinase [Nitrospirota bacterium]
MSHELRTPLNSIIGFSEILEDGIAGPIADNQKELANDISTSGKHLLSLINDILDLSKVEAGKMELELSEFNLEELIDGSLVMFKEKAMKHNIKIAVEVEEGIGNIEADERKIKQVLYNLLSNAMKFTPDGGSVSVAARRVKSSELGVSGEKSPLPPLFQRGEQEMQTVQGEDQIIPTFAKGGGGGFDDYIEISVADTGIGISPEDQKKLFQPFQQIDSALSRKYSGTGLGLNLCKKFIELHGGRIRIESEAGKGSRFMFVLPSKGKPPAGEIVGPVANTGEIVDPVTKLLTWEHVLTHLGRILSFHKRTGQRFGLMRMEVFSDKPVDYAALAEILKKAIRRHEVLGHGESHGRYYVILLEVD